MQRKVLYLLLDRHGLYYLGNFPVLETDTHTFAAIILDQANPNYYHERIFKPSFKE